MVGCAAEHHARKVGLGETGVADFTGGERTQGVGKVLQGSDTGNSIVLVGDVGPFGVNGKKGIGDTHGVPETDHGEEIEAIRRWDMGDARDRRRTRGSRNPVDEDVHRAMEVKRGAVGVATYLI